ncbi:MAG: ABC transporter ATP-binding protein [Odoribacter sp.]|nr:ABC transporter ATP-binding protein [Odoribacter sp.]MDY3032978.1 ABC transporter ATP-binding protein [Odoribacter sp.]
MENTIVSVRNLSHRYSVQWAIRDINFDIVEKGVMGLLGSNGAGKSTTMNIICGVLNQTEGDVFIKGVNLRENPVEAKRYIGFLPQQPPLYTDLTVEEYLRNAALLRLMDKSEVNRAVDIALDKCAITHFRNRLIKNLSGGYQQRVGIAQAIVHNPDFVVLDEPTNGLDPNQIVDIRNLIREIAEQHAVLLSTHILSEVQAICNNIKMIDSGKLVFSGSMEDFDNYIAPDSFVLTLGNTPGKDTLAGLVKNKGVEELGDGSYRIFFDEDNSITERYIEESVKNNWELRELSVERCGLDQIFAQLSGKTGNK